MTLAEASAPSPATLADLARKLLADNRINAARPLIAALRPSGADLVVAAALEARLLAADGELEAASCVLDAALHDACSSSELLQLRAEIALAQGETGLAVKTAADAIYADPGNVTAKSVLGRALLRLGHLPESIACLSEALAASPMDVATRVALTGALDALGDHDASERVIAGGIAIDPTSPELQNVMVLRAVRARRFTLAVNLAQRARRDGALDACGFGLLGHALSSLGCQAEAGEAYEEALRLVPEDPYVRHLVAAHGGCEPGQRAPDDYVRVVFDGYAANFDTHLIELGYRVPGLVRELLKRSPASGPVLDLGCGTGLLALACDDLVPGPWTGVDLSPRMLEAAREKNLYETLHEAELENYLQTSSAEFPLILAADVFCYFGALGPLLGLVRLRLALGGRLVFTVERAEAEGDDVLLGTTGRYAHSRAHVAAAAQSAGLVLVSITEERIRYEKDQPVEGFFVVLERRG